STTVVEVVVLLLVFFWFWNVNNKKTQSPIFDELRAGQPAAKIDLPIWLFIALAGVSCIFSVYKHASIMGMMRLMAMVGVFYLVKTNFGRRMTLRLVRLVIIIGAGMSVFGLGQYFLGLDHSWWIPDGFLTSTYINHNHFAGYLELAIPLAIGLLLARSPRPKPAGYRVFVKLGLLAALLVMFVALIFSQSRGAWICLTVSLIVMNIILIRKKVLKKESLLIVFLLIILGIAFIYGGYDSVATRLRTTERVSRGDFLRTRRDVWQGTVDMIKDNPLIGTGIGTFVWGFPGYRPEKLTGRAHYAYNVYLHMTAEMGVLALPLILWMIGVVIGAGFTKVHSPMGLIDGIMLGASTAILSLALHGLVDFNFHIPANMLAVACLAGIIIRNKQDREKRC
ncbi:MAG: O-antigen ligase family protein, partial [Candidatus Omnitrophota bacterium]|nr:O-antigen ligase family protein [Candidatus Omnitrophota bacterium]